MTLQQLLVRAYTKLGQLSFSAATGGSTSTIADTSLQNQGTDGDYVGSPMFVTRDAGALGAAPEGEFSICTTYVDSTGTFTVSPVFTTAPASGDRYAYGLSIFPLYSMIQLANQGLQAIGDIPLVDSSLTTVAGQREYSIPVALKRRRPTRIQLEALTTSGDPAPENIPDFEWNPAAPGTVGTIVLPRTPMAAKTLNVYYWGIHPELEIATDVVAEVLDPDLATYAVAAEAAEWLNGLLGGSDTHWSREALKLRRLFNDLKNEKAPQVPPAMPELFITGLEEDVRFSRLTGDELR